MDKRHTGYIYQSSTVKKGELMYEITNRPLAVYPEKTQLGGDLR